MHFVNRKLGAFAALATAAAIVSGSGATPASAQSTLAAVQKRGELVCGTNGQLPGFSMMNDRNEWRGLDVDLCRAIAAATLGDAKKVKFVPLTAQQRFPALGAGEVDVLVRNSSVTLQREAGPKIKYAAINYFDGQGFAVSNKLKIDRLTSLSSATICFTRGTTHEANLVNWFRARQLRVTPQGYDTTEAMYDAFLGSRCAAATQDASALAATLSRRGKSADFTVLPEIISKEPLGPYVRGGDDAWLEVVRWSHYAMLEAEERGIDRTNVDNERRSPDPETKLFLGVIPGNGKALGLDEAWAYDIVRQVGNYGERFERNLGLHSPLRLPRGLNALWNKGGQMYPPPMR